MESQGFPASVKRALDTGSSCWAGARAVLCPGARAAGGGMRQRPQRSSKLNAQAIMAASAGLGGPAPCSAAKRPGGSGGSGGRPAVEKRCGGGKRNRSSSRSSSSSPTEPAEQAAEATAARSQSKPAATPAARPAAPPAAPQRPSRDSKMLARALIVASAPEEKSSTAKLAEANYVAEMERHEPLPAGTFPPSQADFEWVTTKTRDSISYLRHVLAGTSKDCEVRARRVDVRLRWHLSCTPHTHSRASKPLRLSVRPSRCLSDFLSFCAGCLSGCLAVWLSGCLAAACHSSTWPRCRSTGSCRAPTSPSWTRRRRVRTRPPNSRPNYSAGSTCGTRRQPGRRRTAAGARPRSPR
eukprot:SAG22_NODE_1321_length_4757_cov_1.980678_3_plen_354_part_00